jgi:Regulator of ribonuclease activity B
LKDTAMLAMLQRKPKAPAMDLGALTNADDRRILGLLAAQGDPLGPARHTRFYFHPSKTEDADPVHAFNALVEEAMEIGFRVGEQRPDMVILEIDQSMDVEVVNAARRLMEHWAQVHGLEFDGWECQVVRSAKTAAR